MEYKILSNPKFFAINETNTTTTVELYKNLKKIKGMAPILQNSTEKRSLSLQYDFIIWEEKCTTIPDAYYLLSGYHWIHVCCVIFYLLRYHVFGYHCMLLFVFGSELIPI